MAMGIETLKHMKTKNILLKLTILLFCAIATPAVFGQTLIWTNLLMTAPGGYDIGYSTNWSGPAGPGLNHPVSGTTLEWNGTVPGPIVLFHDIGNVDNNGGIGAIGGGPGSAGTSFYINAAQTSPVTISTHGNPASAGMGLNTFTVDAGAGQLTLGDTTQNSLLLTGRPGGSTHDFINNTVNPVIICPNVQWQNGAGSQLTFEFDSPTSSPGAGIGDYGITNTLESSNAGGIALWFVTSGTVTWTAAGIPNDNISGGSYASPIYLNYGVTLILKTNNPALNSQAIQNNASGGFGPSELIFDGGNSAPGQTLSGAIGGGVSPLIGITVKSGTLTLSGANLFTGDVTNLGGELIAGRAENAGVSGPLGLNTVIHLYGGTLGWSLANTFDYSSRFDAAPGQQYNFDSSVSSITLSTALASSGGELTKFGNGSIILAGGSSYSGPTTINGGTLIFKGAMTGTGNITVNNGTTLGAYGNGTQVQPATLALGTTSGVTLEFDTVNNTASSIIAAGALSAQSTNMVTINIKSGTFTVGQHYPLFSWGGGAPAPATQLGLLNGYIGNISTNGSQIQLNITGTAYTWTGNNNNSWDTTTANNWQQNGGPVTFANGFPTLFDDSTILNLNIINSGVVQPLALTVNNNTNAYQITSSPGNDIGGSTGLSKQGTNSLSLNGGANAYTGVTTISGGTVTVGTLANGGSPSDIGAAANSAANLVLDGGTLQYTNGAVQIDRSFSVNTTGGTIDASGVGSLQFTNTGAIAVPGSGTRTLILTGSAATTNAIGLVIADSTGGATSLQKGVAGSGAGEWDLIGNNTYSGATVIDTGLLSIGNGGSTGSLGTGNTVDNGVLYFNRTNSLTYSGAISGNGPVTVLQGTVTLAGGNSYTGGTSVSNGATLNIGSGGGSANLAVGSAILNNGFMKFNNTAAITIRGFAANIGGSGNYEIGGSGVIGFLGAKLYTGWTLIDAGATLDVSVGNETLGMATSVITNNGTLYMQRQDFGVFIITNNIVGTGKLVKDCQNVNAGDVTLFGTNTYTGGTMIGSGAMILGDGVTAGAGAISTTGSVIFTNSSAGFDNYRMLEFNRPDSFTFPNNILVATPTSTGAGNRGQVFQNGAGVVTLTGNNTYVDGTIVSNGVLQVGNGGASGTLGATTGSVKLVGTLVFDTSSSQAVSGPIFTSGNLVQFGSGTLTLSGAITLIDTNNNITGNLTASNGTMLVTSAAEVDANINVSGGTLGSAAAGAVSTLTSTNSSMNISSGTVLVTVNKSLAQSNSVFVVTNVVATGGTLKLVNYGSAFVPGDRFVVFTQTGGAGLPVTGGNLITVTAPGVTSWNNNLNTDGSVTVGTVATAPPHLTATKTGASLNLSWPAAWLGIHLQSQTNTLAKGLGTNWVTIAGSDASTSFTGSFANTNVFYRLAP
jgi:autotransporter-associated beta strand protein